MRHCYPLLLDNPYGIITRNTVERQAASQTQANSRQILPLYIKPR
jgi:hypothetical protein